MRKKGMMKKAGAVYSLLAILTFALVLAGCPGPAEVTQRPVITAQPVGALVFIGGAVSPLSVVANVTDGGELSFQWFSNAMRSNVGGELIAGAVNAEFAPTIDTSVEGAHYFYVEVTNTSNGMTETVVSIVAQIRVARDLESYFEAANITLTLNNLNAHGLAEGFFSGNRHQYVRGFGGQGQVQFRAGNGTPSPHFSLEMSQLLFDPEGDFRFQILRHIMYDDLEGILNPAIGQRPPSPHLPNHIHPSQLYYSGSVQIFAEQIRQVNNLGGYVVVVPWTIPARYKGPTATSAPGSGTLVGNQFALTAMHPQIAQHFRNWLLYLNSYGQRRWGEDLRIFALGAQNEYNISVGYEGTQYSAADMASFTLNHLAPAIADIPAFGGGRAWDRIFLSSGERHNDGLPTFNALMADGTPLDNRVDAIFRHYYGNMQQRIHEALARPSFHDAAFHMEVWQTEHNDTTGAGLDAFFTTMSTWDWVWILANQIYCGLVLNDESAWIWWYIQRFYSFLGDGSFATVNNQILPRAYIMSHFSRFAARTTRIGLTGEGTFLANYGTAAGTAAGNNTILPLQTGPTGATTNFNPTTFASGNSPQGGQNQATTKAMAFESMCGDEITVIMFTPTNRTGERGQDAGIVRIDLPLGFWATDAYLMRTSAGATPQEVSHGFESVILNEVGSSAIIEVPRSNIVSVRFTR